MMTFESKTGRWGMIACLLLALAMLSFAIGLHAQENPDKPPQVLLEHRTHQISVLTVEADTADVPKLRTKAISILKTRYGLTAAEAAEKVMLEGKTNVALCQEYVIIDALLKITQIKVGATAQERRAGLE